MTKKDFCDIMVTISSRAIRIYNMVFNTRIKKVTNTAIICFSCGIFLTAVTFTAFTKWNSRKGVGGFETQTSPELSVGHGFEDDIPLSILEGGDSDDSLPMLTYSTYRVKQGDMIGIIADEYNVTQDTIISVNNIRQSRLLQVGQYLKIPSMPGILYTVRTDNETFDSIAEKYEINAEKCAAVNSLALDCSLKAGNTLFLPDAQMDWVTRQEINGDLFHKPLKSRYWLSSPYGWRSSPFTGKRSFHGGSDMAVSQGTPVYAALGGTVSFTGYNETYGNYIIVTHHSGYKSLYAHLSAINCKKGQYVYTSTVIGKVGSTGMSTGPHLHFAVYKNGKSMNPMSLIN